MNQTSKTLIFSLIISLVSLYALQSYKIISQTVSSNQVLGDTTIKSVPCDVINTWQQQFCSLNYPTPTVHMISPEPTRIIITPTPTPAPIVTSSLPSCVKTGYSCGGIDLPCCLATDRCINYICVPAAPTTTPAPTVRIITPEPTVGRYTTPTPTPAPTKIIYRY